MEKKPRPAVLSIILCIGISLAVAACVQPVNSKVFLADEKVQDLIGREPGVKVTVKFEIIDGKPVLSPGTISFSQANLGTPAASLSIAIGNSGSFDPGSIRWYYNDPVTPIHT